MQVGKAKQVYWWQSHCAERENKHVARKSLERVVGQFQRRKPADVVHSQARLHRPLVACKHTLKRLRIAHLVPTYTFIIYGTQRTQITRNGVVAHASLTQPPFVCFYFIGRDARQGNVVSFIKTMERAHSRMIVAFGRLADTF